MGNFFLSATVADVGPKSLYSSRQSTEMTISNVALEIILLQFSGYLSKYIEPIPLLLRFTCII